MKVKIEVKKLRNKISNSLKIVKVHNTPDDKKREIDYCYQLLKVYHDLLKLSLNNSDRLDIYHKHYKEYQKSLHKGRIVSIKRSVRNREKINGSIRSIKLRHSELIKDDINKRLRLYHKQNICKYIFLNKISLDAGYLNKVDLFNETI